jgi:uncharacterized membrane protein YdbT with pleckstrin-like domain
MSYLAKTLSTSEKLLCRGRIQSIFRWRIWALFILLLAVIAWAALTLPDRVIWPYILVSTALALFGCLGAILPLWTLEIGLTENRVIVKRGLIAYSTHELELKTIEEVNVRQSWFGRIFDYGTLQIRGIGVDTLVIKRLGRPLEFRRAIEAAIRNASGLSTALASNASMVKA